jgi:hypothetical protein
VRKLLTVLIPALAFGLFPRTSFATPGKPRCYVHGYIVPSGQRDEKVTLTDMVRLNFEADSKEGCEQLMARYCGNNVKSEGYLPTKIEGSFKPDRQGTEELRYRFTQDCSLQSE